MTKSKESGVFSVIDQPKRPTPDKFYSVMGGKVKLRAMPDYPRAGADAVLLAAAIGADSEETVVEAGSGSGALALCVARRVGCRVEGIELQSELAVLGSENIALNDLSNRVSIHEGDIINPPSIFKLGMYDHAVANPPYFESSSSQPSSVPCRALSHHFSHSSFEQWFHFLLSSVKPKGTVTLIGRAERIGVILKQLEGELGDIVLFPLWPRKGTSAKLVIIRGRRGTAGPMALSSGLVLHASDGSYTEEAEQVLRHGSGLIF